MKIVIDTEVLEQEGFEIEDILSCYGTPYEERPTGEWIYGNLGYSKCSNCNYANHYGDLPFCPNCGVDMRGG